MLNVGDPRRNSHILQSVDAAKSCETDKRRIYMYGLASLEKEQKEFREKKKHLIEPFSERYEPNPWFYQYDLEMHIFLNYEKLAEKEDMPFEKEFHLQRAIKIRWPSRVLPDGAYTGKMVVNPWTEELSCAVSNYERTILFGGGGQGKSYFFIGFMCLIYDHFIFTEKGAQCTFSTVSEPKIKGSLWPYVNKLYPVESSRPAFSLYAGKGKIGADYSVNRVIGNKKVEKGGRFVGVLLAKGRKDATVIDKLTGCHDPIARVYLLDEAQSTDSAPIDAYVNMYLHPTYKWFFMAGNYDEPEDLLGINVGPSHASGWGAVDETSHIWEGVLKSKTSVLDLVTCVIHLNNELSPAITSEEGRKKWRLCCPTEKKRDELYKTEESRKTNAYRRFWIGFRYEKDKDKEGELVCDMPTLKEVGCAKKIVQVDPVFIGSFDSAPASKDRNIFTIISVSEGPLIQMEKILAIKKATERLKYYEETTDAIVAVMKEWGIESGHFIMDFTNHTALIEMLAKKGIVCHHLIYQEKIPDKIRTNEISGITEKPIALDTIRRFVGDFEKSTTIYAHQRIFNKITLGAYVFAMFLEKGLVFNFSDRILNESNTDNNFEREFCLRRFKKKKSKGMEVIYLDSKEEFKDKFRFSPDIADTIYQAFYMLYVIFEVRPNIKSIGKLRGKKKTNNNVDRHAKVWHTSRSIRSTPRG